MLNKFFTILIVCLFFAGVSANVSISIGGTSPELGNINCFDYYKFSEGVVLENVFLENDSLKGGDTVELNADIVNNNSYAVVNLDVVAQVYLRPKNISDELEYGSYLLDEFVAEENINLKAGAIRPLKISWKIPKNTPSGNYFIALFINANKNLSISGLSFSNYIFSATAYFTVENQSEKFLLFDLRSIKVNGEQQKLREISKTLNTNSANIEISLINNSSQDIATDLDYELYWWDTIASSNKISKEQEKLTIKAKQSHKITKKYTDLGPGTYVLKITANYDGQKTMAKIRFSIIGAKGKIIYAALTKFPLTENSDYSIFACFTNGADYRTDFNGKVKVSLLDEKRNKLEEFEYVGTINPTVIGQKQDFTAKSSFYKGYLVVKIMGPNDESMEETTFEYDFDRLYPKVEAIVSKKSNREIKVELTSERLPTPKLDLEIVVYDIHDKILLKKIFEKTSEAIIETNFKPGLYTLEIVGKDERQEVGLYHREDILFEEIKGPIITPKPQRTLAPTKTAIGTPIKEEYGKIDLPLVIGLVVGIFVMVAGVFMLMRRRSK
ncbi:MAG: hypothetical protein N3F05_04315 [Candidatus Diapherotrites archaeon]|nr:hypothetical protein [Candidatus Diapherotrites archaeon]